MKLTEQEKSFLLDRVKKIAEEKGGKCLSDSYVNALGKLEFKCSNPNHQTWKANYINVAHNNSWCPCCKRDKQELLNRAIQVAKEHGGECLTTEYNHSKDRFIWKCSNPEHATWESRFSSVVNGGHWCPNCYEENGRKKPKKKNKGS